MATVAPFHSSRHLFAPSPFPGTLDVSFADSCKAPPAPSPISPTFMAFSLLPRPIPSLPSVPCSSWSITRAPTPPRADFSSPESADESVDSIHTDDLLTDAEVASVRPRSVRFHSEIEYSTTFHQSEYDRSSISVAPLTRADIMDLLHYRAEMHRYTEHLLSLRQRAFAAQRELIRQQEMIAFEARQRNALAAAAAALQCASNTSTYTWEPTTYVNAAASSSTFPNQSFDPFATDPASAFSQVNKFPISQF